MTLAELLKSIFLGIVQGLTEFLPISSSAHLNIFPWLFKWDSIPDSFDLALHIGTLFSILIFFYKDWIALIKGGYKTVVKKEKNTNGRLFWLIVFATIPAGVLGLVFEKIVGKLVNGNLNIEMIIISAALIIMGVILYIVDKNAKSTVSYKKMPAKSALAIGTSQALAAAIPGVSRSGITITVSRACGLDRESAAKYSFLLSAPIVAAAALVKIKDFSFDMQFFAGVLASFISGMLVIKFLMAFVKNRSYKVFAVYRVIFGLFILAVAIIRMF